MAITLDIWEDSGAVVDGHGTTRVSVNNIGWKASTFPESVFYELYPLYRPQEDQGELHYTSYHKYNYLKISGTYPNATRVRARFEGLVNGTPGGDPQIPPPGQEEEEEWTPTYWGADKLRVYYRTTNIYAEPTRDLLSGTYLVPGDLIWFNLSTVGPELATSPVILLNTDTTYWTNYLVTQLYVEPGSWLDYGNIGMLQLSFRLDEYETAL